MLSMNRVQLAGSQQLQAGQSGIETTKKKLRRSKQGLDAVETRLVVRCDRPGGWQTMIQLPRSRQAM